MGGLVHLSWTQDGKNQTRLLRVAYVRAKREPLAGHLHAGHARAAVGCRISHEVAVRAGRANRDRNSGVGEIFSAVRSGSARE